MNGGIVLQNNIIAEKSLAFAIRIVKLCRILAEVKHEYVLSKQLIRSGTSIGANVREAVQAQSKKDFISKMSIALKEAAETEYWLILLKESGFLSEKEYQSISEDCAELNKILIAIVKSSKS